MSAADLRILFVFIDGFGIGEPDPAVNPLFAGEYPALQRVVTEGKPIDACLGVDGLPQSATGQAALLTGVNVPDAVGGHQPGFPGPTVRAIVEEHNIFRRLLATGRSCTFANAYHLDGLTQAEIRRRQSVTTVATMQAFGGVRGSALLAEGRAVYQDITRELLRARGYDGPLCSPTQAASDLVGIAAVHDFTLFEYFQTDVKAHKGAPDEIARMLAELDEFLGIVLSTWPGEGRLLVVTSDHGNIEDGRVRSHTRNPVPFFAAGERAEGCANAVNAITDVTPALLQLLAR